MKICVVGLWHLGSVTAACLAHAGHQVVGLDDHPDTIAGLQAGKAPLYEPALDALIASGLNAGRLGFTSDASMALADADLVWITYDTPVDDNDNADTDAVMAAIMRCLPLVRDGAVVLVSSQLPVGSIKRLEDMARSLTPDKSIHFATSPENLRLGKAIDVFMKPDRIIVGVRNAQARAMIEQALAPLKAPVEWMSVESAEMTKHAINAFLAVSVTFANELASLCERVGADAKQVERGLKSEARIGPKAYLSPGGPFAGGTLARDLIYLETIGQGHDVTVPLLSAVRISNEQHKNWIRRKLLQHSPSLAKVPVAIWGMTYKPGTDTLRRSLAVDLCNWLIGQGAVVHVHDPVVTEWPEAWHGRVNIHQEPMDAVEQARFLVIGTEWTQFHAHLDALAARGRSGLILLDPNRHVQAIAGAYGTNYLAVGVPDPEKRRTQA